MNMIELNLDRFRLTLSIPGILPVGVLAVGWPAQYHGHWIVLVIGTVLRGLGLSLIMVRGQGSRDSIR